LNFVDNYSLTTGFFGKLPKFADFVKLNASGNEIVVLDQWLQEGLATAKLKYKNEWKSFYQNTTAINFIYPFSGTENIVVGTICPSNDKSGRSFPFILFGNINREIIKNLPIHLSILEFEGLFKYFESIFQTHYQNENLTEMKSLISSFSKASIIQDSVVDNYKNYLAENSIRNIFNLDKEDLLQIQSISINNLLAKKISFLENSPGIRFTFSTDENNEMMKLSFITELLLKSFGKSGLVPALFWTKRGEDTVILYIFFQKPTPGNFLDLIHSEEDLNQNSPERIENRFKESTLINEDTSLIDILSSINFNVS